MNKLCTNFLLRRRGQYPTHEDPVGDDLQPGVGEAGRLGRPQDVKHVAVGGQHLNEQELCYSDMILKQTIRLVPGS